MGRRGRMVVGFTTIYAIGAYHHSGEVHSIQHYVMQWFSPGIPVSSTKKTDRYDVTEILLNVELIIITLTLTLKY